MKLYQSKAKLKILAFSFLAAGVGIALLTAVFCIVNGLSPSEAIADQLKSETAQTTQTSDRSTSALATSDDELACQDDEILQDDTCVPSQSSSSTKKPARSTRTTTVTTTTETTTTEESVTTVTGTPVESTASSAVNCQNRLGPIFVRQVHWYTEDEKLQNGFGDLPLGITTISFKEPLGMHLVDGVCHPTLSEASAAGLIYGSNFAASRLDTFASSPDPIDQAIYRSDGQDMVIWYWSYDPTDYTIEYLNHADEIWDY